MPPLVIPRSGMKLESSHSPKAGSAPSNVPAAIGLTLTDGMIEDMIKCVQDGRPLELSLGDSPSLNYGDIEQPLSTSEDPFRFEIFQTTKPKGSATDENMLASNKNKANKATHTLWGVPLEGRFKAINRPIRVERIPVSPKHLSARKTNGDTALENLRESLASEKAKKQEHSTTLINATLPGKRGALSSSKNKLLSQRSSLPSSPALSAIGSPSVGPTSTPSLSQQQAEQAKSIRKPIIHLLAVGPMTEKELVAKVSGDSMKFKQALEKVGDLNQTTSLWELRKNYFKELDVWTFDYEKEDDRQKAINNAVKIFDKMRLGVSEPEWEKLNPKSERGKGISLSKLQAQIAQGPFQRSGKSKDPNRSSPEDEEVDLFDDKETKGARRTTPQPPAKTTKKKMTEKEAQAKRLLSKKPAKPAATSVTKPTKKEMEKPKQNTNALSAEFVSESDDEAPPPPKPAKVSNKRPREEQETSDSNKKIKTTKKESIVSHRVSDASQSSRPSTNSTSSSANSFRGGKVTSPPKSSPLASSPPTNASDVDRSSASSASPSNHHSSSTLTSRSPINKRHHKSSSVASSVSSSSSTRYLKPEVLSIANKWKLFYPKYEALHRELRTLGVRDEAKEATLLDMHDRLVMMKKQICEGIVEE